MLGPSTSAIRVGEKVVNHQINKLMFVPNFNSFIM